MLDYSIMKPEGILLLKPQAPLNKEDFAGLSTVVDSYLTEYPKLRGVLIHAKAFPGWENFEGLTAHMHFVFDHHKKVERVAIVTDSPIGTMAESLARHFTSADVRHFAFAEEVKALEWLRTN